MTDKYKLSKSDLEYYISKRPRVKDSPGYFNDAGEFIRGPFYYAQLGTKGVGYAGIAGYIQEAGGYRWKAAAIEGAKMFQAKCQELLDSGEYSE